MSPLCSRNARPEKALVERARWGTHPVHPGNNIHEQACKDHRWSLAAALFGKRRVPGQRGYLGRLGEGG